MLAVEWAVNALAASAALGVLFAAVFVTKGIGQFDPGARGSGAGFRLVVFPGSAALWPLLLAMWISRRRV